MTFHRKRRKTKRRQTTRFIVLAAFAESGERVNSYSKDDIMFLVFSQQTVLRKKLLEKPISGDKLVTVHVTQRAI